MHEALSRLLLRHPAVIVVSRFPLHRRIIDFAPAESVIY